MAANTHYEVLGVAPGADAATIKQAYRRLARQFHPDRTNNDQTCAAAMRLVNAAHEVLSDPKRRAAYDKQLATQARAQQASAAPPEKQGFHVELGEARIIIEKFGGDLLDLGARHGRDKVAKAINKRIPLGSRGQKIIDEIATLGSEKGRETLEKLLKKFS